MNRIFFFTLVLFASIYIQGQVNTDVYLFDLKLEGGNIMLSNPKNISNNEGYDNQPSFLNDRTVLFSSTRNNQTDILRFNIEAGSTTSWITNTPKGSEYSPLKIPNKNAVSAIRLDLDGLQRLYQYDIDKGNSKQLLEDLKVGYHVWYNDHILVSSVLVEDRMDLVVSNLRDSTNYTFQKNVGRSLWKIPDSDLISYISKEQDVWQIKSLDPISGATKKIADTYKNAEDMCWLNNSIILTGSQKSIMKFDTTLDIEWNPVITFKQDEINNISRIAVNPSGNRLAFVAEESPTVIVQKQVEAFNKRDLKAFVSCYRNNVLVQRFPNDTMYVGRVDMTANYRRFYENTKEAKVEVTNRIRLRNKVIDEETSTVNGRKGHQVALYEIKNGLIASMTFIFPEWVTEDAESIVNEQLKAYNNKDLDAFMGAFSEDVELFTFPNKLDIKGHVQLRKSYSSLFEKTPDLHCDIKNRIVIGNKVIDEEYITANGSKFSAVAIYEVKNGKISKVTFLQ